MKCNECNSRFTKEEFSKVAQRATTRLIKSHFRLTSKKLYRLLKCGKWREVKPAYQVTLPNGKRVTWPLIKRVLSKCSKGG